MKTNMKRTLVMLAGLMLMATTAFAGVADGTWRAAPQGDQVATVVLQSSGTTLTGTADGVQITEGRAENNLVWFTVVKNGVAYRLKGEVSGRTLRLYQSPASGGPAVTVNLTRD